MKPMGLWDLDTRNKYPHANTQMHCNNHRVTLHITEIEWVPSVGFLGSFNFCCLLAISHVDMSKLQVCFCDKIQYAVA